MLFPFLTRYLLGLATVALAAGFCARSAQAGVIVQAPKYVDLDQGLVGFWSFDGKTVAGTRVYDASGNGTRGVMTNGPRLAEGKIEQGMEFDGVNDYIGLGNVLGFTSSFSISAWVFATADNCDGYIINKNGGPGARDWSFVEECGSFFFRISRDGINTTEPYNNTATLLNTWVHVVGVYDASKQSLDINRNAVLDNGSLSGEGVVPSSINATANNVRIGSRESTAAFFKGKTDDVRVYNRPLSPDEIKQLYKIGATAKANTTIDAPQSGLVGHWSFDGSALALGRAPDASGNGNEGRLTNGPVRAAGKIGQGMQFDGVDDYVDVGDPASGALEFDNTQSFSISAWVKAGTQAVNNGGFVDKWPLGNGPGYWCLIRLSIRFRCQLGDGTNVAFSDSTTAPNNTWHHLVWTVNRDTQVADLYIHSCPLKLRAPESRSYGACLWGGPMLYSPSSGASNAQDIRGQGGGRGHDR